MCVKKQNSGQLNTPCASTAKLPYLVLMFCRTLTPLKSNNPCCALNIKRTDFFCSVNLITAIQASCLPRWMIFVVVFSMRGSRQRRSGITLYLEPPSDPPGDEDGTQHFLRSCFDAPHVLRLSSC